MSQDVLPEHIGVLIANEVHEANLVVNDQESGLIFVEAIVFVTYRIISGNCPIVKLSSKGKMYMYLRA